MTKSRKPSKPKAVEAVSDAPPSCLRHHPLSHLEPAKENIRSGKVSNDDVADLVMSIRELGLLQPLIVKETGRQQEGEAILEVVAGSRRLRAIELLRKEGTYRADQGIPVHVLALDASPTEIQLAENYHRKPMHPLDVCDAGHKILSDGKNTIDTVARTFGVTPARINRWLALANLIEPVKQLFRQEKISEATACAFTLGGAAAQQRALKELKKSFCWRPKDELVDGARTVKGYLTEGVMGMEHALFTLEEYQAAGGEVVRDLFFEEKEDGAIFVDRRLFWQLQLAKLGTMAERMQGNWKELQIHDSDHQIKSFNGPLSDLKFFPHPSAKQKKKLLCVLALRSDGALVQKAYEHPDDAKKQAAKAKAERAKGQMGEASGTAATEAENGRGWATSLARRALAIEQAGVALAAVGGSEWLPRVAVMERLISFRDITWGRFWNYALIKHRGRDRAVYVLKDGRLEKEASALRLMTKHVLRMLGYGDADPYEVFQHWSRVWEDDSRKDLWRRVVGLPPGDCYYILAAIELLRSDTPFELGSYLDRFWLQDAAAWIGVDYSEAMRPWPIELFMEMKKSELEAVLVDCIGVPETKQIIKACSKQDLANRVLGFVNEPAKKLHDWFPNRYSSGELTEAEKKLTTWLPRGIQVTAITEWGKEVVPEVDEGDEPGVDEGE